MARIYEAKEGVTIPLGRRGENEALQVRVNVESWISDYGNGTFGGLAQRPGDEEPYPVTITLDGNFACWTVNDVDTAVEGFGRYELDYFAGDVLAKSMIWRTEIQPSLADAGPVPDPYESWVEEVLEAGASVLNKIDKVAGATAGNLPEFASDGSLTDSGIAKAEVPLYGVCSTAADTAAKTVSISGFALVAGAKVTVKFTAANTAASPTLNVSGTGAKGIKVYGTTAAGAGSWQEGSAVELVYDGTNWVIVGVAGNVLTLDADGAVRIADNTDLNTIITPGNYKVPYATSAQTMTNGPVSNVAYRLIVMQTGTTVRYIQIAITNSNTDDDKRMAVRYYSSSGWTAWQFFASISSIDSRLNGYKNVIGDFAEYSYIGTSFHLYPDIPAGTSIMFELIDDTRLTVYGMYGETTQDGFDRLLVASEKNKLLTAKTTRQYSKLRVYSSISTTHSFVAGFYNDTAPVIPALLNSLHSDDVEEHRILILGDSYSQQARWVNALSNYILVSDIVNLGVTSATFKDRYEDRTTYPYTSRPTSSVTSGNQNTFMCQIEKLKRLMAGTDLDEGETAIYQTTDSYPDIIIIEGGQNDSPDTDAIVSTYREQFTHEVNDVYVAKNSEDTPSVGSVYVKTPLEDVNRTCFAGAYRAIVEELQTIFPKAQIFATSRSMLNYWRSEGIVNNLTIKSQQETCCDICGINFIDWQKGMMINKISNYPKGDGTQENPYCWGEVSGSVSTHDTYDLLHPSILGAKKLAKVVANAIKSQYLDINAM